MKISIIVAKAKNLVIGKDNQLIWRLSSDLQLFKKHTSGHYILMGRKTYESIGKPLPNRTSLVISRNPSYSLPEGHHVFSSLDAALHFAQKESLEQLFVIGGAEIYRQVLPYTDEILLTEVKASPQGDVFFPELIPEEWKEESRISFSKDEKNEYDFDFVIYKRICNRKSIQIQ